MTCAFYACVTTFPGKKMYFFLSFQRYFHQSVTSACVLCSNVFRVWNETSVCIPAPHSEKKDTKRMRLKEAGSANARRVVIAAKPVSAISPLSRGQGRVKVVSITKGERSDRVSAAAAGGSFHRREGYSGQWIETCPGICGLGRPPARPTKERRYVCVWLNRGDR